MPESCQTAITSSQQWAYKIFLLLLSMLLAQKLCIRCNQSSPLFRVMLTYFVALNCYSVFIQYCFSLFISLLNIFVLWLSFIRFQ